MGQSVMFLMACAALAGGLMTLWGSWYLITAVTSWRRPMDCGRHKPATRFAVVIAARNEALVIPQLVESLMGQNYPRELYDVWVVPNNCTDNTGEAARRAGACVLECTVPVKSKGEVLRFAYRSLMGRGYDAFVVFDADNVAHPDFLREMNNAYRAGARAAQGYRDSKNPYDTAVSGCSSIYYWMMNRFHSQGKAGMGLSALINGTGFMVAASTLEAMGGWQTHTISEDLELTVRCAMAGVKVWWIPKAITYDEQPLSMSESVKQRKRWCSGTLQVSQDYLPQVGRSLATPQGGLLADLGSTMLILPYQVAALGNLILAALAAGMATGRFSPLAFVGTVVFQLALTALSSTAAAALVITLEDRWDSRLLPALGLYWLFVFSWLPITLGAYRRKTTVWEEIRHTRSMNPMAIPSGRKVSF